MSENDAEAESKPRNTTVKFDLPGGTEVESETVQGEVMGPYHIEDGRDGDDDDDDDDNDDLGIPSDLSDEHEPELLDDLDSFVEQLSAADKKRKIPIDGREVTEAPTKRRILPVDRRVMHASGLPNSKISPFCSLAQVVT